MGKEKNRFGTHTHGQTKIIAGVASLTSFTVNGTRLYCTHIGTTTKLT